MCKELVANSSLMISCLQRNRMSSEVGVCVFSRACAMLQHARLALLYRQFVFAVLAVLVVVGACDEDDGDTR